jgi:glyoxylase-like metal-dependent hydrolase (beta-lactamase superfamily II)
MAGTWTVTQSARLRIHTFTAPEDGWLVNSHIIEFPSQLFVVDAQYTLPYAREVVAYANKLGKPLSRLYVTHYHPDHLLGASEFKAPLFALSSVAAKIAAVGDRVASEEHEKMGDDVPTKARQPDHFVEEGDETIDGIRIEHRRLRGAETDDALTIAIPGEGSIVVQDLIYNRAHVFVAERHFDSWRAALKQFQGLPYNNVLPGHGAPGDHKLYDAMTAYLDYSEVSLGRSRTAADFKQRILERYGDFGCRRVLDHQLRFLFR